MLPTFDVMDVAHIGLRRTAYRGDRVAVLYGSGLVPSVAGADILEYGLRSLSTS